MVLTIKHRFSYYRRYNRDIWGLSFSDFRFGNKINAFFYSMHMKYKARRTARSNKFIYGFMEKYKRFKKKKFRNYFVQLRLVKLFFLTLTYRQFRNMAYAAAAKEGLFKANYCSLLEGRLLSFIYRTNFLFNFFQIIPFIKTGNVLVNNRAVDYVNYVVKVGDFVTFLYKRRSRAKFRRDIQRRITTKTFLFNTPRYMFVSYKLYFAFMERAPVDEDLVYPLKLDIYRATAFY